MSIPAVIYLCLAFIGLGIALAKDGQPITGKFSFFRSLLSFIGVLALLYWGGFFGATS